MTDRNMPDNATDWAKYLLAKPLLSPFRIREEALRSLRSQKLSYANIARQLTRDPVLSYSIMRKANQHCDEVHAGSKTLDHAISMIGIEQLKQVIQALPSQDAVLTNVTSLSYVESLGCSLYAAHLGRAISKKKAKGNPEEIYWSSLFLHVPLWYLWCHAAPEMRQISEAIWSNFKLPETAEQEVLGESILNISKVLMKNLELPVLTNHCYDEEHQPSLRQWVQVANMADASGNIRPVDDRALSMAMQSPTFIVMLANMVASHASHDWYSRACLRSQRILANYLHVPLSEAVSLSHRVAASMSRAHPIPGIMAPASRLFAEPRKRIRTTSSADSKAAAPPSAKAPESKPAEATAPSGQPRSSAAFNELVLAMSQKPEAFADLHELMNAATHGLTSGLRLKRAMVCLINRGESRLNTYFHVGSEKGSEFSTFKTKLIPGTIFAKLAERPASIWVKPHSDRKIANLVPMNFKQIIEVDEFFLMSVFLNSKPVAILYADNYHDQPLTETQYSHFKALCVAVGKALKHQAARKAKQNQATSG